MTSEEQTCTPCSLPDTQNAEGMLTQSQEVASQQQTLMIWGKLYSLRVPLKDLEMTKDQTYSLGRSESCDISLNLNDMQEKWLNLISKVHFCIYRGCISNSSEIVVYLEDRSYNGTFVNGVKVGRGNRVIIENNSDISLIKKNVIVYRFMNILMPEINELPLEIKHKYALGRKLGSGACGEVRLVFMKDGTASFAMKTIPKYTFSNNSSSHPFNDPEKIRNEVEILKKLKHPCVIRMEDICDTPSTMYIFLELMEGGELFDRIRSSRGLPEFTSKLIFYQVILAVHYLHMEGVTHRDLKPENILLASHADITLVKISDFGLSKLVDAQTMMKTFCGTPLYVAPEILETHGRGSYTNQVDVWSLGVILYVCLSGISPFNLKNKSLEEQIRRGIYTFPKSFFGHVSPKAVDLIKRMMTVNTKKRIPVQQILLHPWLSDQHMFEIVNTLMYPNMNNENAPPSNMLEDEDLRPELTKRARFV